jgi:hypothetical protein
MSTNEMAGGFDGVPDLIADSSDESDHVGGCKLLGYVFPHRIRVAVDSSITAAIVADTSSH